ncbi:hypothetical protein HJFPF1_10255 [Paramyrothecium foliicola]|nr:hypothetical protein HJFPF1_10255 [Paramyrothecium foliicola]
MRFSAHELLPKVIDYVAHDEANAVRLSWLSSSTDLGDVVKRVKFNALAYAIHGSAWYLRNYIHRNNDFKTLTYIDLNDARCAFIIYTCNKAGFTVNYQDSFF